MKRALWVLAISGALLAPSAFAQESGEPISGPRPPYTAFAPPEAVDHQAVVVVTPVGGPPRTELVTVTRSGAWQREIVRRKGVISIQYADFERGVSVMWTPRSNGREYLQAYQDKPDASRGGFIRERTGEKQTWAGEACEVWSWRSVRPNNSYGSGTLSCVTHDGIELWRGYRGYDGKVTEYLHAMLVERRKVLPEEVRLPPSALDWTRWRAGVTAGNPATGHEVILSEGENKEITIRRRGDWTMTDARFERGERSSAISHPQVSMNFRDNRYRRSLTLGRYVSSPETIGGKPVPTGREETILGRHCVWYNTMPDIYDAGTFECRDLDGVVLAQVWTSRGNLTLDARATRFSATPAAESAFALRPEDVSWITGLSPRGP